MAATAKKNAVLDREPLRAPIHAAPAGRVTAIGRDGKPIWRKETSSGGIYDQAAGLAPHGWSYEWKRHTIYNQPDPTYQAELANAGWSPVEASRHDGVFMPLGTPGAVIVGGLMLMERPMELTNEARREEAQRAKAQVYNSKAERGLANDRDGFTSVDHPQARKTTFVREDVGPAPEIERPKYNMDIDA